MNLPIILASTSIRRHELLSQLNLPFVVEPVEIDERIHVSEEPDDYVMRMVQAKAEVACANVINGLVITADTIGVIDGEILTKPTDKAHAFAVWDKLSDNWHEVWTVVCVSAMVGGVMKHQKAIKVVTDVHFIKLSNEQKERYWATGEPSDKAGAYAIQGGAMSWVRAISGSYTNVVGLPLAETATLIHDSLSLMDV